MQHMIKDEGNVDQDEFHTTFIPTWCLNASDDDFLCREDLPINSPLIINDGDSIDEVNSLEYFSQSSTTTDVEITSSENLQTSPLIPEMEVFTFDDVEEFSGSDMIITRIEELFQEKDDELSRNPLQSYMQVEYEFFSFFEDGHQEKLMNQACTNINEYSMTSTIDMEIKDNFQAREDETSSSHSSSCMKLEFEAFKFTSGDYNEENIVMVSRTREVPSLEEMYCDIKLKNMKMKA